MRSIVVAARRGIIGALALGAVALSGLLPMSAAHAETVTTVTVDVKPGTVLERYTPTTVSAAVTPVSATGSVTFLFDGEPIGNGTLASGVATFSTNTLKPGTWALRAQYVPTAGSDFAAATSAPVTVTVNDTATILLADSSGNPVPVGGQVKVGQKVVASASGWPGATDVSLAVGTLQLAATIRTNASGSGSVEFTMPTSLQSAVYLLSASGGRRSAGFVFYVYNPPKEAATPSSAASVPVATTPQPVGSVITVTPSPVTLTPTPYTTTLAAAPVPSDGLARTGGNPLPLVAGAMLAVGVGASLMSAGRSAVAGRHQSPRRRA